MAKQLLQDMVRIKHVKKFTPKMESKLERKIEPKIEPKVEPRMEFKIETKIKPKEIFKRVQEEEKYSSNNLNQNNISQIKSRFMLWFIAFVSVIFCFFAISFLFSRAEVTVKLKTKDVVLNENLSASLDSSADVLPFELAHFSGEDSKTIILTEQDYKESAKGQIIVYNKFSKSAQTLAIDTRLEGSNNKIYKTKTKVVVPGMAKDGTPGQMGVDIYASEQGASYNSGPLDFKIVAFKGTSKYAKFDGRSVGSIEGGIVGKSRLFSDTQKEDIAKELEASLRDKLYNKIASQIPGFLLYKEATTLKVDDIVAGEAKADGSAILTLKGTLYGIIFNEQKLTQKIAKDNIEKYDNSDVYIPNIKDLVFTLSNKDNISFDSVNSIDFSLTGPAKIVWKLDVNKFTASLLNISKKEFTQTLVEYPGIDSATLKLSPPWIQTIPDKSKDIKMTIDFLK